MLNYLKERGNKDPIFIHLIKYGENIALAGTDVADLKIWSDKELNLSGEEFENLRELFFECFVKSTMTTNGKWVLKNEYYFRLLEYRELQEARIASKQANRNSWIAICFSIVAICISGYLGWAQLSTPIKIDNSSIQGIAKAVKGNS